MRNWCIRHPLGFMALYTAFYLAFFFLLERTILVPDLWVHCRLDYVIPFVKQAVIPYYLWYAWVPATLVYLLYRAPRAEFWRLCLPLFAGMTLSLLFCAMVPNGVHLRPHSVPGTDLCAVLVRALYKADTNTNVCPSIHVLNSMLVWLACWRCSCFNGLRRVAVRAAATVLNVSIILSTMLLKQHSVIDVVCGILLALALDALTPLVERDIFPASQRQRKPERIPERL